MVCQAGVSAKNGCEADERCLAYLVVPNKLYVCTSTVNYRFVLLVNMIFVTYVVEILETVLVSIHVTIFVTFLVDCQNRLRVQNEMTSQYLLHIKPRTLQIQKERKKVI